MTVARPEPLGWGAQVGYQESLASKPSAEQKWKLYFDAHAVELERVLARGFRHKGKTFRLSLPADRAEVSQEIWMEFFAMLLRGTVDPSRSRNGSVMPLLKSIAAGKISRHLSRQSRLVLTQLDGDDAPAQRQSSTAELRIQVRQVLGQLSPKERQVLLMTVEGHTCYAIGGTMNLNPSSVRRILRRIRMRLGDWLRDGGHDEG